jgi:ATP-dependent helicase HrpA
MERAKLNPVKDKERVQLVAPYINRLKSFAANTPTSPGARQLADAFRWMVEEFKVSVFAQELGTAIPISAKRLDEHLARIG